MNNVGENVGNVAGNDMLGLVKEAAVMTKIQSSIQTWMRNTSFLFSCLMEIYQPLHFQSNIT
jgi:hypothetical protein